MMTEFQEIATGLRFPEGPIAMPDGSVVLVEIERQSLSRVSPGGQVEVIAELGGGPNGAAIGPDGRAYVCNNGGMRWRERDGRLFAGLQAEDYSGGRIQAVDLRTGAVEVLYTECAGEPLKGPNDIVFDRDGGFWFTDNGKVRRRSQDRGSVFYATIDGKSIREEVFPSETPNGVGLSPEEDRIYVAETQTGRLWAYALEAPGVVRKGGARVPWVYGELLVTMPNYQLFDSLAVDGAGNVCVATLESGAITVVSPDGGSVEQVKTTDHATTNICFGGDDLRTAYITLSSTGRLVATTWPRPGLPLNFLNK